MCGRYYIEQEDIELQEILAALGHDERIKTGEIYPTNTVPVLTSEKRPQLMRWGFTRYDGKGSIINARSETVTEKPMFQKAMRERKCLIPASWYFEWKAIGAGKKQKHAISLPGHIYGRVLPRRKRHGSSHLCNSNAGGLGFCIIDPWPYASDFTKSSSSFVVSKPRSAESFCAGGARHGSPGG